MRLDSELDAVTDTDSLLPRVKIATSDSPSPVNLNESHLNNRKNEHNGNGISISINNNNNGEEVHQKRDSDSPPAQAETGTEQRQETQVHKSVNLQETDSSLITGHKSESESKENHRKDVNVEVDRCDGFNQDKDPRLDFKVKGGSPTVATNGMNENGCPINEQASTVLEEIVPADAPEDDEEYYYYYDEQEERETDSDSDATITNEMLLGETDNGPRYKYKEQDELEDEEEVIAKEADENEHEWTFGNNISTDDDYTDTAVSDPPTPLVPCSPEPLPEPAAREGEQESVEQQQQQDDDDEGIGEENESTATSRGCWIDDNKLIQYENLVRQEEDDDDQAQEGESGEKVDRANQEQNVNTSTDAAAAHRRTGTFLSIECTTETSTSTEYTSTTSVECEQEHAQWKTGISTRFHHPENEARRRTSTSNSRSTSESGTNNKTTRTCIPKCTTNEDGNGNEQKSSAVPVAEKSSSSESSQTQIQNQSLKQVQIQRDCDSVSGSSLNCSLSLSPGSSSDSGVVCSVDNEYDTATVTSESSESSDGVPVLQVTTADTSTQYVYESPELPDNNGTSSKKPIESSAKLRIRRDPLLTLTRLLHFRDKRRVHVQQQAADADYSPESVEIKQEQRSIKDNTAADFAKASATFGAMHQRVGMANSTSSSTTSSSSSTLRSVLRRPGLGKQRPRGRVVTFNESLNLFYDAECSCWVHEDEYSRMRQEEIERRERESEMYQQQYEMQMQQQYLQPYEYIDDPPTLSPPEGYKDRFFPQEFFTMEPDVTRVSPPSPPAARRKVFLKENSMPPHLPPGVGIGVPGGSQPTTNGQVSFDEDEIGLAAAEFEPATKKKGSRYILGGILKGGRLWRSNSNDGKKVGASTPPEEPDIVKCSEASPTQYSQTEPLQQHTLQTQYYETNSLMHQHQQQQQQMAPTKVDIGTAPLRTSEQIRLAVDSTLRMRSSNKKKPECSSLVEKLRWLTSLDDEDSSDGFTTWPTRDKNGVSINGGGNGSGSGSSPINSKKLGQSDAGTSTNEELFVHSSNSMRQQQPVQEAKIKQISYTLEDIEEGLIKGTESELETFITKDGGRIERLRKRYGDDGAGSNADDYGFSRRPSVKGIKPKFSTSNQIFAQFTTNNSAGMTATLPNPNRKSTSTPIPVLIGQVDNNNSSSGILMSGQPLQQQMINPEFQQQQRLMMNSGLVGGEGQYENTRLPENNLIVVNSSVSASGTVRNHAHVSLSPAMMLPNSASSTSTNSSSNGGGSITSSDTSASSSSTAGGTGVNNVSGNNNNNDAAAGGITSVRQAALNYEFQNAPGRQTEESRAHFEMIRQSFENATSGNGAAAPTAGGAPGNFVNYNRPHSWSVSTLPHQQQLTTAPGANGSTNLGHTQSFNSHNSQQPHHIYQQIQQQPTQQQHQHAHSNSISGPMTGPMNNQNNMYGTLTNSHQHPMTAQQQQQQQASGQQQMYGSVRRVPNVIGRPLFLHYNGALSVEAHPNKIVYPKTKVPETPSPTQPPSIRYYGPPIRYYNPPPPVPPRTVTAQSSSASSGQSSNSAVLITAQSGINNLNHPHGAGGSNHPHVNVLMAMNDVERGAPEGATDEEPNIKEPSYLMNV